MADIARTLNPDVDSLVRSQSEDDTVLLTKEGIGTAFFGEEELAKGLSAHVGSRFPN
jgi:CPA2 family monovalent cation:H+ antiporter-2